jgi:hypothetical protein
VTVNFSDACDGFPAKYEYEGKPVCILHFPHSAKNEEFDKAVSEKLEKGDYNFHGCHFPSGFESVEFCKTHLGRQPDAL